ncbi:MAG: metallophosphoesterase [Planctomycetes bacterium]|nr:metallophosphoesterase [Planctomycetota bacterium]
MSAVLRSLVVSLALGLASHDTYAESITRIWLTHPTSDAALLMVNWETATAEPSRVSFGPSKGLGETREDNTEVTLHHVSIPFPTSGELYYRVTSGTVASKVHRVQTYSGNSLRVALAADWQSRPDLSTLLADQPHLLMSCGDLVDQVFSPDRPGELTHTQPFSDLIDRYPRLFATVPFMPALGNHDHQIRPRSPRPPTEPVYDIEATAFRSFFPLPEDGWKWHLDVTGFSIRFLTLDLNHVTDQGTTWQSCHPLGEGSAQLAWYRETMSQSKQRFVVTLYNEQNRQVRSQVGGVWGELIQQGTAAITGYGHFAERSEVEGFPYFNTALLTNAPPEKDEGYSKFIRRTANYVLLTVPRADGAMTIELKGLDGTILDRSVWNSRSTDLLP